jgi:hypothetical protein
MPGVWKSEGTAGVLADPQAQRAQGRRGAGGSARGGQSTLRRILLPHVSPSSTVCATLWRASPARTGCRTSPYSSQATIRCESAPAVSARTRSRNWKRKQNHPYERAAHGSQHDPERPAEVQAHADTVRVPNPRPNSRHPGAAWTYPNTAPVVVPSPTRNRTQQAGGDVPQPSALEPRPQPVCASKAAIL